MCKTVAEAADTPYSYVLVATKAIPELIRTPKLVEPLLSESYTTRFKQPTNVLLQNGLNVERDLYESVTALGQGEPSIVSAAVWIGTNLVSPNVIEHGNFVRETRTSTERCANVLNRTASRWGSTSMEREHRVQTRRSSRPSWKKSARFSLLVEAM